MIAQGSSVMRSVVGSSLRFRLLVMVAAAALIVVGVVGAGGMRTDLYPEFTPPYVEVQTEALGLSAAEVEQLITVPLEADLLNGVAWLDKIRSESLPGLSSIFLLFEPGTNLLRARQMVSERLNQPAALPSVSKPPVMLPPLSSTSRTMMIGLSSQKMSLIDVGVLARWTIKPRLMGVPGVANVTTWGHRERQLQVQVDPNRLQEKGVSLSQVLSTTGNSLWVSPLTFLEASTPGAGGFFDAPNQRLQVRHESPIIKAGDLARVPLEGGEDKAAPTAADGTPLRLADVADVVEDHQPLIGDAVVNGEPGIMLVIEKLPTANTLEVTRGVEEAVDAMRPGLRGLEIDTTIFRPASFIHTAIHDLGRTLVIGFVLMLLALALLFYQWRAALVAVVAILSSVMAAALVFSLRGSTFNTLVFAGLAVGLAVVIDDAIVGAENVARRLREHRQEPGDGSIPGTIRDAIVEARSGLMFATLIIVLPLVPIFFLTGLGDAFGRPLALSYVLALLVSMVVALTVTPAVGAVVFSKTPGGRRESPVMKALGRGHHRLLSRALRTPRGAFVALAVMAVAGLVAVPQLKQSPVPTFKETDFVVELNGPGGTSLPEMQRITGQVSRELQSIPGVRRVGGHVGRAIQSDRVVNPDSSELWVSLDPRADYDTTVASVRKVVKGYPGVDSDVLTYPQERFKEVGTGADEPVVVRLFGAELDVLRPKAGEVSRALDGIKGITNVHAELPQMEPTLEVEVDLQAAQAAGIKPGDIRREATTLLSGVLAGNTFEDQKVFEVVVWGTPETRQNLNTVRDLLIDTPSGGHVRLGDVAKIDVKPSPNVIERDAVSRFVDVTASVSGRSRAAVLADVRRHLESVDFPLEYHYELVGNYAERQAMRQRILVIGIGAAIGIFLLLQATLGTWLLAALLFLTGPVALVGGALAVLLDGGNVELGALVGFLAVFGIAIRTGVILIKRYQHLERHEGVVFGVDLVLRGTRDRFPAVMLTATATALFFAPFVLLGDLPGHEIVNPMGAVILGGLVTSTILNLFLLPSLYLRFGAGQGGIEELDLRDLWEVDVSEGPSEPVVRPTADRVGSEVGSSSTTSGEL